MERCRGSLRKMPPHKIMSPARHWIELASQGIEGLAVVIMLSFILIGTARWLFHSALNIEGAYETYRVVLGKALLIGLELLVATDIIRTVAFDLTLMNIFLLGGLVLVRTFLGWTLTVEVDGRWPWQRAKESAPGPDREAPRTTAP